LEALKINELFYSIQGESLLAGKPTVFVRTSTCPMRFVYCDTKYAFYEGTVRSLDEIVAEVRKYSTRYVCVTGGEPLGQRASIPLMQRLIDEGYIVSLETGGGFTVRDVPQGVIKVLDVKTPESGEDKAMVWENLDLVTPVDQLKFVVSSRADFDWSIALCRERALSEKCTILFSPVHGKVEPADLADWILASREPVTMQLQMHKTIWGASARGV
jgi:7-carboxy-7-deazaguanine synthase